MSATHDTPLPRLAYVLGLAGLLPQVLAVIVIAQDDPTTRFTALAFAYAYAALIFSFLGGLWWGIAASAARAPVWLWFAAVAPSLIALATAIPWTVGATWPGPSLLALALGLFGSLVVDEGLERIGLAPRGWRRLRMPLSLGLGGLTLLAALL